MGSNQANERRGKHCSAKNHIAEKVLWLLLAILFSSIEHLGARVWAAEPGAMPVTIQHALGSTTISREPERIVTIGWNSEDVAISLGKIPVAFPKRSLLASEIFPWVEEHLGQSKPVLLDTRIDFEAIAMLRPDVILAVRSGVDEKDYARLSTIAPTVVYRSGPWKADWKEQTSLIGAALGQPRRAAALIAETEAFLERLKNSHPELDGRTFTMGMYAIGKNDVAVYLPSDPRVQTLRSLGLKIAPGVESLADANPGKTTVGVSFENVYSVDADFLILWFGAGGREELHKQALFQNVRSVKRGTFIGVDNPVTLWGIGALSVLSIPYVYPELAERMSTAIQRAGSD